MRPRQLADHDLLNLLPATISELARQTPIGKAAVHYRLRLLEEQGMVERVAGSWPHVWTRKGN